MNLKCKNHIIDLSDRTIKIKDQNLLKIEF